MNNILNVFHLDYFPFHKHFGCSTAVVGTRFQHIDQLSKVLVGQGARLDVKKADCIILIEILKLGTMLMYLSKYLSKY